MSRNADDEGGPQPGLQFRLIINRPDGGVDARSVGSRPLVVGRALDCDVRVEEERVSRHHCVIFQRGGALYLQDPGSANGTYVNDSRVRQG